MFPLILAHGEGPVILALVAAFYGTPALGIASALVVYFSRSTAWRGVGVTTGVLAIAGGLGVITLLWSEVVRQPVAFSPPLVGVVLGAIGCFFGFRSRKRK